MRTAVSAAIIENRKILLVRKKQTWILPGGKPQTDESDTKCLCREVREELSGTELKDFIFYRVFEGKSPHKKDILEARVYFAKIKGKLQEPSGEISSREYVGIQDINRYNVSDITLKVLNSLRIDDYL